MEYNVAHVPEDDQFAMAMAVAIAASLAEAVPLAQQLEDFTAEMKREAGLQALRTHNLQQPIVANRTTFLTVFWGCLWKPDRDASKTHRVTADQLSLLWPLAALCRDMREAVVMFVRGFEFVPSVRLCSASPGTSMKLRQKFALAWEPDPRTTSWYTRPMTNLRLVSYSVNTCMCESGKWLEFVGRKAALLGFHLDVMIADDKIVDEGRHITVAADVKWLRMPFSKLVIIPNEAIGNRMVKTMADFFTFRPPLTA
jgi:hypothetical protein